MGRYQADRAQAAAELLTLLVQVKNRIHAHVGAACTHQALSSPKQCVDMLSEIYDAPGMRVLSGNHHV